jgi:DNA mismatch repair protein MutS2
VIIRKSYLRRRAERGYSDRSRDDPRSSIGSDSLLDATLRLLLTGTTARDREHPRSELEQLDFPDLLSPASGPGPDRDTLLNLLDLAFLGRASAGELDADLDGMDAGGSRWTPDNFAGDLFLGTLVRECMELRVRGQKARVYPGFLERVLRSPPTDLEVIRFRQAVLRELEVEQDLLASAEVLLVRIYRLLSLLRASRDDARLEPVRFRLDVLRAFADAVTQMVEGFAAATSGLARLHECGTEIRRSTAFQRMQDLLDHQSSMATLRLEALVDAKGRLRHLEIRGIRERKGNPFYRRPLRRWWDRLRALYRRYDLDAEELVDRLVMGVYQDIAPAMAMVVQLVCHLQLYLAARTFAATARARGLEVCLADIAPGADLHVRGLFNPLLLSLTERPVPSDLDTSTPSRIALVTGPNSGGKTRLLQAVGINQVLAQSGLYAPCSSARLPLVDGLFASIVESDRADQSEGRLGTELVRLRSLFETSPPGSLILLDELCSGTNPSEAIEIVAMVLRLLRQLRPVAFVTTHFLDFAHDLEAGPSADGLLFLQAEVDARLGATYRFIPGVATTSLAVGTARRLGVTFEELEQRLKGRTADDR